MSDLKRKLSDLFSEKTLEKADDYRAKLSQVDQAMERLNSTAEAALRPIDSLDNSFNSGKDSLESFNNMTERMSISLAQVAEKMGQKGLAASILASANAIVSMNEDMARLGGSLDSSTESIRKYRGEMFEIASSFGAGYDESQKLAGSLGELAGEVSDRSVIGFQDLKKALKSATDGMGQMGISYDKLFGDIDTGAGSFKTLEAAILLGRKAGEDIRTTMNFLSTAVQRNGMSVEDAVVQYSAFFDTAEKSGLKFDEVKTSLNQVAQSYSLIGINADFARPIIETFGRSLAETGLGISNATRLSESLSRSFAGVANSYEKAYLMTQKGGLDVGQSGGGVLGASIGLRARIMRAEEAGDQSEIGLEMAEAMKKTLESMSGGMLVNLEEAADGGEALKSQFFKQESLMNSMFGLDKDSAARTIEMLQKLDDTTVMGNEGLKSELGKNINDQLKNQDKNLGYQDRIAVATENMFASSILTNEILMKTVDKTNMAASGLSTTQSGLISGLYDNSFDVANSMASTTADLTSSAEGKLIEMSNAISKANKLAEGKISSGSATSSLFREKNEDGTYVPFDFENSLSKDGSAITLAIEALSKDIKGIKIEQSNNFGN